MVDPNYFEMLKDIAHKNNIKIDLSYLEAIATAMSNFDDSPSTEESFNIYLRIYKEYYQIQSERDIEQFSDFLKQTEMFKEISHSLSQSFSIL